MRKFFEDSLVTIYKGDCRSMPELADNSIQCVVTSPPYWGLRKYSGEQDLIWGGDGSCEHLLQPDLIRHDNLRFHDEHSIVGNERNKEIHPVHSWVEDNVAMDYVQGNPEFARPHREKKSFEATRGFCSLCGAWKGAYGLETTPELYVQHTIEILREIRRVLRKDGVVFWNIGDSYWASASGYGEWTGEKAKLGDGEFKKVGMTRTGGQHPVLKPKDLCLIPFRVAIAAQEDGWWVRSVIIWSKPNPMPESVKDRPTESHEYILMLTKSKKYYWDADAVREPHTWIENRASGMERQAKQYKDKIAGKYARDPSYGGGGTGFLGHSGGLKADGTALNHPIGRNIRTVWEFPTQPYPEAHFAVFPEKLPEICIKAATPEVGCCSKCGAPYERISERQTSNTRPGRHTGTAKSGADGDPNKALHQSDLSKYRQQISYKTLGWQPTCKCKADKVPSMVLDPFAGAGTTLWVAKKLGRKAIGYEISEEYCKLAIERCRQQTLELA